MTTKPAWSGPVLFDKTLSCFPETTDQDCGSCSQSEHRRQLWPPAALETKVPEPEDWVVTGTQTPEPFPKLRVHCPGRYGADAPLP